MAANEQRLDVHSTRVIPYPQEWTDQTGPFGGAYQWAINNLVANTEVIGMREDVNRHGRPEVYKFRLILGPDQEVRGKMELDNGMIATIKNGFLGLMNRNDDWLERWVMVTSEDGSLHWSFEWERKIVHSNDTDHRPPLTAFALISKCHDQINPYGRTLNRNWCQEVFGFRALNGLAESVAHRHLVNGPSTMVHRLMYKYIVESIADIYRTTGGPNGRKGAKFSHENMDDLVKHARTCLGI